MLLLALVLVLAFALVLEFAQAPTRARTQLDDNLLLVARILLLRVHGHRGHRARARARHQCLGTR